jgi:lipopolysaccharide/colanic/teichoic acid biosynthesis glycosyltransferase
LESARWEAARVAGLEVLRMAHDIVAAVASCGTTRYLPVVPEGMYRTARPGLGKAPRSFTECRRDLLVVMIIEEGAIRARGVVVTVGEAAWDVEIRGLAPVSGPAIAAPPLLLPASELGLVVRAGAGQRAAKRVVDVVVSFVLLVVGLPLFAAIALCVRVTSSGPVFFRQRRVGRGGKTITVTKFRTMVPNAVAILENDPELKQRYVDGGYKLHQHEDPRLTRTGCVLRRLSLDELPQLWDVLVGRMSLVGPRPVLTEELVSYGRQRSAYVAVKPGLTGLWQVGGRSDIAFPERCNIDMYYATRWTLWLDMKVLLRTVPAVVRRRGAY